MIWLIPVSKYDHFKLVLIYGCPQPWSGSKQNMNITIYCVLKREYMPSIFSKLAKFVSIALLLLFSSTLAQKTSGNFSIWGFSSVGLSSAKYSDAKLGPYTQLGFGLQYKMFRLKFDRRLNNEITLFVRSEKTNANTILLGYAFRPNYNYPRFLVIANIGIGSVTTTKRGERISSDLFDNHYKFKKKNSTGIILEVELEYRFSRIIGINYSLFANLNSQRNFYGVSIGVVLGYW